MRNRYIKASVILSVIGLPLVAFAETDFSSLGTLVKNFTTNVVQALGYLALTAAVVAFFFGVVQFIWASKEGKDDEMTKGKSFMMWGLVALFVMFSVWGIVKFAQNMFGIEGGGSITIPTFKFNGGNTGAGTVGACTSDSDCPSGKVCQSPGTPASVCVSGVTP